jgi:hypothetical protein
VDASESERSLGFLHRTIDVENAHLILWVGYDYGCKMTVYGYARLSTDGQTSAAQDAAVRAAGYAKIHSETASDAKTDRAALRKAIARLNENDTRVVTRLDRLARSTRRPPFRLTPHQQREAVARRAAGEALIEIARTFGCRTPRDRQADIGADDDIADDFAPIGETLMLRRLIITAVAILTSPTFAFAQVQNGAPQSSVQSGAPQSGVQSGVQTGAAQSGIQGSVPQGSGSPQSGNQAPR